jgi:hypothetical protein
MFARSIWLSGSCGFLSSDNFSGADGREEKSNGLAIGLGIGLSLMVIAAVVVGALWQRAHRPSSDYSVASVEVSAVTAVSSDFLEVPTTFLNIESVRTGLYATAVTTAELWE